MECYANQNIMAINYHSCLVMLIVSFANNKTIIKSLFRSISQNITFVLNIALDLRSRAISRTHVIFCDIELTNS